MEYWKGYMDWPLDQKWACEVCGGQTLIWGMVHAQCRCGICHTHYHMRDDGKRVTIPIWQIKPEYATVVKEMWQEYQRPIEELDTGEMSRRAGLS